MPVREWTDQQQAAIFAKGGTILVSAAAGSGKTAVLTQRILEKLTDSEKPGSIDRILACTFSNDAAAEMRERIGSAIADRLRADPTNAHLRRQQVLLPTAQISTVHGFCLRLLQENFHLAKLDPTFRIADQSEAESLKRQAVAEALEDAYQMDLGGDFQLLSTILSGARNDKNMEETVLSLHALLMSCADPERWLCEVEEAYTHPKAPQDSPIWAQVFSDVFSEFTAYEAALTEICAELALYPKLNEKYGDAFASDLKFVKTVKSECQTRDAQSLCHAINGYIFPRLGVVKGEYAEERARFQAARDMVKSGVKNWAKMLADSPEETEAELLRMAPAITALIGLFRRFSELYQQKKDEKRLVDFNDLEHKTLCLLLDRQSGMKQTPLAMQIAKNYDEILLDEYQDINGVQEALFRAISQDGNNLFMVGDVKQCIYHFRLANPTLFAKKKDSFTPYDRIHFPAKIVLDRNFRSRAQVTAFINAVFAASMSKKCGGLGYEAEDSLVAAAPFPKAEEPFVRLSLLEAEEEDANQVQAEHIAKEIRRMLDEKYPVKETDDTTRPCRAGDFAILLRSVKGCASVYLKALAALGIDAVSDSGEAFFETKEISFLYALMQAIDNPLIDLPLAAAMTGPVFDFSPDDLALISKHDQQATGQVRSLFLRVENYADSGRKTALAEKCRTFLQTMQVWRLRSASLRADKMLRILLEETNLPELMQVQRNGAARVARIWQLVSLAAGKEDQSFLGLSGFVRLLADWQEKGISLDSTVAFSGENHVRILSIHKSKGLEFPVVFVANLQKEFNLKDASEPVLMHEELGFCTKSRLPEQQIQFDTLPRHIAAHRMTQEQRSEEVRIFYVALTRAKERLHLVASKKDILAKVESDCEKGLLSDSLTNLSLSKAKSYLELLAITFPNLASGLSEGAKTQAYKNGLFSVSYLSPEKGSEQSVLKEMPILPEADAELAERLRQNLAYQYPYPVAVSTPAKRSVSQLKAENRDDDTFALSKPSFVNDKKVSGARRGTAVHLLLEKADFITAHQDPEGEIQRLLSLGLLDEEEKGSLPISAIKTFFTSDFMGHILESKQLWKEQKMLFSLPLRQIDPTMDSDESMVLQGVADCIYETADGLGILDYKTDRGKTAEELIACYAHQLELYAAGIQSLLGKPVTEAVLYSLELNQAISVALHQ